MPHHLSEPSDGHDGPGVHHRHEIDRVDHDIDLECPGCRMLVELFEVEAALRDCSLRLWVAGWSPIELLDEVVRVTGLAGSRDFVVQVLLVDDSHRSEQARTPQWTSRITALRAMTAIDDVSLGWLGRWIVVNHYSVESECILNGTLRTLQELLHPSIVA